MKRSICRAALTLAAAILLTVALTLAAAGADAIVLPEHALDSLPAVGRTMLDDFTGTSYFWQSPNKSSTTIWYVSGYGSSLFCKPGEDGSIALRRAFPMPVSVEGLRDLLLYLETSHDADILLTLETAKEYHDFTVHVTAGAPQIIAADLSEITASLTAIDLVITPSGQTLSEVHLLSVRTDTLGLAEIASRFGSLEVTVTGADTAVEDGKIILKPMESTPRLRLDNCTGTIPSAALFRVVLDTETAGGAMVFSMTAPDGSSERCGSVTLGEGRHVYLMPVLADTSPYGCTLQFLSPDLSTITVESVSLLPLDSSSADTSRGGLTSCQISADGKTLVLSGKLTSETAAAGIGGKIRVYAVDNAGAYDVENPLGEAAVSTRFSFSIPVEGLRLTSSAFLAALLMPDGSIVPLGESLYAAGREADNRDVSVVGLTGAAPADALLSNASRVIVDVYLDRLIGGTDGTASGTLAAWNGRYYSLDANYIRTLDDEIAFYHAAGLRVYLRFLAAEDLSARSLTLAGSDDASYFALNATTTDGQHLLAALSHYIAARYPAIDGVILGMAIDEPASNAATCDASLYLRNYASALRIVYHAMLPEHPTLEMLVPMVGADGDGLADGISMAAQLARLLARRGGIAYRLLYVADTTEAADADARFFTNRLASVGVSFPMAAAIRGGTTVSFDDFAALCEAAHGRYSAVFLSAGAIRDPSFYTKMKSLLEDGKKRFVETSATLTDAPDYTGSYPLWDFTSSFDALGWISDGTFQTPRTATSRAMAEHLVRTTCRTLQAASAARDRDAVILCLADGTLSLTDAPYVDLTLRAEGQTDEVWLTVLFGAGDTHTEYRFSVPNGVCTTVTCPLDGTAVVGNIEYVAVSGDAGISLLEIASVSAGSVTKSDEELAVLLGGKTPEIPPVPDRHRIFAVALTAAAITVLALLFLCRRGGQKAEPNGEK